jgi:hypothetical protein
MSDPNLLATRDRAPRWAVPALLLGVPIAVLCAFQSLGAALSIGPLFDFTPAVVLVSTALSWRWGGASKQWFRAAGLLALLMTVEWIPWYVWIRTQPVEWLNVAFEVYFVQGCLLLVLYLVASVRSIIGIRRASADRLPE